MGEGKGEGEGEVEVVMGDRDGKGRRFEYIGSPNNKQYAPHPENLPIHEIFSPKILSSRLEE